MLTVTDLEWFLFCSGNLVLHRATSRTWTGECWTSYIQYGSLVSLVSVSLVLCRQGSNPDSQIRWLEIVSRRMKTAYKCARASIAWHKHGGRFWILRMRKCRSCWFDLFAIFILSFTHKLKSSCWIFPIFGLFDYKDESNPHIGLLSAILQGSNSVAASDQWSFLLVVAGESSPRPRPA